jgi:ABC-type sugar transport system substrate-binding protein
LGLDIEILYADNNCILQIQHVLRAVHGPDKPAGVVMEPVKPDGMESVVRKVAAAGVGLAILNCTADYVSEFRSQYPGLAIFTVSSDQVEIGRIQGRQVCALLPASGGVLYIHGPVGARAAMERGEGFDAVLGKTGIHVVKLYGLWTEESAEAAVAGWLRLASSEKTPIHVVAAQDDSMARGARRALEAPSEQRSRREGILYLGTDGVPDVGQQMVNNGQLTATIVMPSNTGAAIEHMARWLAKGTVPASVVLAVRSYPSEFDLIRHSRRTA